MKIVRKVSVLLMFLFFLFTSGGCLDGWGGSSDNGMEPPEINDDTGDTGELELSALKSFTVGSGELMPFFSADCHDYQLELPQGTQSVYMRIDTDDPLQSITVNGNQYHVSDFPRDVTWDSGNRITLKVLSLSRAENEYRISVTFKPVPDPGTDPAVTPAWHHISELSLPYRPGALIIDPEGRIYVHMGHKLYRYMDGKIDESYGTGGSSAALVSAGTDNVAICMDKQGNVYVPTGSGGNVEKVLPSGVVETLFISNDAPLDLGTIRAVVLDGTGSIMWLVQSDGSDDRVRGIMRMELQNENWVVSDGSEGRSAWGVGGTLGAKEFNSNMRSLVLAGDFLYLGLGSTSRKVYRIDMTGSNILTVVDMSSSGENTGETGSCGFLCSDSQGNLYVPVLRDGSAEYSEIRIYRFDGSSDILSGVISGQSVELCIPRNNSGISLGGFSVSADGKSLWFGRSDETVHGLKLE